MSTWPLDPGWLPQESLRERQARTWGAATPPFGPTLSDRRSPTALDILRAAGLSRRPGPGVQGTVEPSSSPYAGADAGLVVCGSTSRGANGGGKVLSSSSSGAVDGTRGFASGSELNAETCGAFRSMQQQ
ncbi:hypothetical protein ColTof4_14323 [Colletotrichum tofieldiae]|nr:hypothetical protein ColTof3_14733 [Colletotrichum tofieldiae]GKT81900.1 hypothetical protein ColTof4_14323 [Colletotrichum tofieldiae]